MYQYKGHRIVETDYGYLVYTPKGERLGPYSTTKEAEEAIDEKTTE